MRVTQGEKDDHDKRDLGRRRKEGAGQAGSGQEGAGQEGSSQEGSGQEGSSQEGAGQESSSQEGGGEEVVVAARSLVGDAPPLILQGWKNFDYYSGKASEISRRLSLLGFATILFFAGLAADDFGVGKVVHVPGTLLAAGTFLAASLMLDLLQYLIGTVLWYLWPRREEYRLDRSNYQSPKRFPTWLPFLINIPLVLKFVCCVTGWTLLLIRISYSVQ